MGRKPQMQTPEGEEENSKLVVIGGREINQISYAEDIHLLDRPSQASMEINEEMQAHPLDSFRNLGDILRNNAKIIRLAAMTTVDGLTATTTIFDKFSGKFVKTPDYKARLAALTFLRDTMNGRPGNQPIRDGAGDRSVDIGSLMSDPGMAEMIVEQSTREAKSALTAMVRGQKGHDATRSYVPPSEAHPLETIAKEAEALTGTPLNGNATIFNPPAP